MRSAIATDTLRYVRASWKRFASLAAICVLGVTMLVGLTIACEDLRLSADEFFDAQRLWDVSVQSTLGLGDADVEALAGLDGVEAAEGSWSETAYTNVAGAQSSVSVHAFVAGGMNEPYLVEGRLPKDGDEVAVTTEYLEESGKRLGDTLSFGVDGDESAWTADEGADKREERAQDLLDEINDPDAETELDDDTRDLLADITAENLAAATTEDGIDLDAWADLSDDELTDLLTHAYEQRFDSLSENTDDGSDEELFARHAYTIVAVVIDPMSVAAKNGSSSFRATGAKYSFFVTDEAATSESYSVAYLRVEGASELSGFSDEYDELVERVTAKAEAIKAQRETARPEELRADATEQIDDAESDMNVQFDDAEDQLAEAQATIDDALAQIAEGWDELASSRDEAYAQLAEAQATIDSGRSQLDAALASANAQIEQTAQEQAQAAIPTTVQQTLEGLSEYQQLKELKAGLEELAASRDALQQQAAALQAQTSELQQQADALTAKQTAGETLTDEEQAQLTSLNEQITALGAQLTELNTNLATVEQTLAATEAQAGMDAEGAAAAMAQAEQTVTDEVTKAVNDALPAQIAAAKQQIYDENFASLYQQLADGQAELDSSRAEAEEQLAEAEDEAAEGQAELDESREEFEQEKAEALAKIADARAKLADIGEATWYVQDRSSISSYASIDSDASSIEVIGTVFPAIFLTVAILMSLTTATRMVEEDRGLIGLYKALGYARAAVMGKYVAYAAAAAMLGCAIGAILGFVALPWFLFSIFEVMYTLPAFTLHFSVALCALACGMFVLGIGAATALAVRGELAEQPAQLMRPRAPRAGKRILLERLGPLWRRLSFLNKVTARNLFRYKRRMAMTIFGVAGCCALMIVGFAIADTVLALCPNQYGGDDRAGIYEYDLLAVTQPEDLEAAATQLTGDDEVERYIAVRCENVTLTHNGAKETVQLVVVPEGFTLSGSIRLVDEAGQAVTLDDSTVLATKNASTVLGFGEGDEISLQDSSLDTATATVSRIVMNYLGNAVYLTEASYERLFGKELEANALMAQLSGTSEEQIAYKDELAANTMYLSVTSIQEGIRDFSANFMLIWYVVVLLIVLAAGLSFVVLFTLSTTNISERERELATIKVLGFRRGEVRVYIYKELLALALIGTLAGVPVGGALGHALTYVLNMPSMYFAVEIHLASYLASVGMSLLFAVLSCLITSRALDRIDMVAALKSAE